MSGPGTGSGSATSTPSLFSPYANLPAAKESSQPTKTGNAAEHGNPDGAVKRPRGEDLPKEWGWVKVPSKSRPGKYAYVNKYTKEKIGWLPDRPASKKRKELPPAPKVEKRPKRDHNIDPEQKLKEDGEKLGKVLGKVIGLLQDPDNDKFKMGLQVLHKSFHSSAALSGTTEPLFFQALEATQADPGKHLVEGNRGAMKRLFKIVQGKVDGFDESHRYQLQSWIMRCVTHHDLFTDDSYKYNAAVKVLRDALFAAEFTNKKRIIELAGTDQDFEEVHVPPEQLDERKQVIVETMATLESRAGLSWAQPTVRSIFKDITDRRQLFSDAQRLDIDQATDAFQERMNGKAKKAALESQNAGMMQGRIIPRRKF